MKSRSAGILLLPLLLSILFLSEAWNAAQETFTLTFVCCAENDLYRAVRASGIQIQRYDSPEAALDAAPAQSSMLVLADGYPEKVTEISLAALERIEAKKIRLYVEYPSTLPGLKFGRPVSSRFERLVVSSDFASPLHPLHILTTRPVVRSGC